jgi:hypothetical protein
VKHNLFLSIHNTQRTAHHTNSTTNLSFNGIRQSINHKLSKVEPLKVKLLYSAIKFQIQWAWIAKYNKFTFNGSTLNDLWLID